MLASPRSFGARVRGAPKRDVTKYMSQKLFMTQNFHDTYFIWLHSNFLLVLFDLSYLIEKKIIILTCFSPSTFFLKKVF